MKLGSLFDGIGTFPLSGIKYGFMPVWASEIEAFPIAVTKHHFPDMKHLGDITKINGAEIEPVDVITFGSPCQDMSVAGKRAGLEGERSGLFMQAVRIIREMRIATGRKYPRFIIWENVPGAYSSNNGEDFRAVLEEIAETEIPMPESGKWAEAGMVRTERVDIAWRTLDAQHWGVPQRRRRIFLVADFGGQCAGEILFVEQGLPWNSKTSGKEGQTTAANVKTSVGAAGFKSEQSADARGIGWQEEIAPTLPSEGATPCICLADQGGQQIDVLNNISPTLRAQEHGHQPLIMEPRSQDGVCRVYEDGIVPTLNTAQGGQRRPCVISCASRQISQNIGFDVAMPLMESDYKEPQSVVVSLSRAIGFDNQTGQSEGVEVSPSVRSESHGSLPCVASRINRTPEGITGAVSSKRAKGTGGPAGDEHYNLVVDKQYLFENHSQDTRYVGPLDVAPIVSATFGMGGNNQPFVVQLNDDRNNPGVSVSDKAFCIPANPMSDRGQAVAIQHSTVRRLTPGECELLQGLPLGWTNIEGAKDTNRYKAIGNGIAKPCSDFVLGGIARVMKQRG